MGREEAHGAEEVVIEAGAKSIGCGCARTTSFNYSVGDASFFIFGVSFDPRRFSFGVFICVGIRRQSVDGCSLSAWES